MKLPRIHSFVKSNYASCSFRSLCCILRSFKTGNSVCIQHQLLLILPLPPLRRRAALKRNTLGKHQNMSCNENQYSFYQNLISNIFVCPAEENASLKIFPGYPSLCPHSCCVQAIGVDNRGGLCLNIRLCLIRQKIVKINTAGSFVRMWQGRGKSDRILLSHTWTVSPFTHVSANDLSLQTERYQNQSPNSFLKDELEDFFQKSFFFLKKKKEKNPKLRNRISPTPPSLRQSDERKSGFQRP